MSKGISPFLTPDYQIQMAKVDLANKLRTAWDLIRLDDFEVVQWPDGSLGCPNPLIPEYVQSVTPGYVIILEYASKRHFYYCALGFKPFYCSHPEHNSVALRLM